MLASQVIALARSSELKKLNVKDDDAAILGFLNLAILEIHKRFNLIQGEALVTMVDGTNSYTIDESDTNVTVDFSMDDLLVINKVYNYDGQDLPLNDEESDHSVATPRYNVIEVPDIVLTPDEELSVIYRASPKFLTDAAIDSVPLPSQFLEPLLLYIGYKAHASIKGGMQDENNLQYQRFDKSCRKLKVEGLYTEDALSSHKFYDRGFV